ncbi:MAG: hypothetical protein AAF598_20540, partial [Bacteroidota bacterium]
AVQLYQFSDHKTIWVEKEGANIGKLIIPWQLKSQIDKAPGILLDLPKAARVQFIDQDYGKFSDDHLAKAITALKDQLGVQKTKSALAFLKANQFHRSVDILLDYYDQVYTFQIGEAKQLTTIKLENHEQLIDLAKQLHQSEK